MSRSTSATGLAELFLGFGVGDDAGTTSTLAQAGHFACPWSCAAQRDSLLSACARRSDDTNVASLRRKLLPLHELRLIVSIILLIYSEMEEAPFGFEASGFRFYDVLLNCAYSD